MYKYELYTPNFLRRVCPGGAEDNGPMCTPKPNGESCVSLLNYIINQIAIISGVPIFRHTQMT